MTTKPFSQDEAYCAKILTEIATMTKCELSAIRARIYMEALSQIGWTKAKTALERCVLNLKGFPSVSEILEQVGIKQPDASDEANALMGKIIHAISTIGGYRLKDVEETIGLVGIAVAENIAGSWSELCMMEVDSSFRAQLRDQCKALIAKQSVGELELKPRLLGASAEALSLISGSFVDMSTKIQPGSSNEKTKAEKDFELIFHSKNKILKFN